MPLIQMGKRGAHADRYAEMYVTMTNIDRLQLFFVQGGEKREDKVGGLEKERAWERVTEKKLMNREGEWEKEGQRQSRKYRRREIEKKSETVRPAAYLAPLHEVNKLPKSKASCSSIIPKWEVWAVEWGKEEGEGGTEWDRGEWVKV